MSRALSPAAAKEIFHAGHEIAFLDLREAGQFADGHPLFAVPCPFSRLELIIGTLVPRLNVPILLIDANDTVADRAARALERMGYTDVSILDGGAPGWAAAGFTLYQGVNVPSKAMGELAEHRLHPKTIDAKALAAWRTEGREFHFFDCRPADEYRKMRVPGSLCMPNGELAHRFDAVVENEAPVVLTCAGRTRGITGVLGLGLAGIGHDVFALENGTQGWFLAGQMLERDNVPLPLAALPPSAQAKTQARAKALIAREGLPVTTVDAVLAMRSEAGRTTYLLDVRSDVEATTAPLPAFTHALSGQLVQATDQWVGVRRARLVLADDLGLRAAIAAYWLRALGYDVHILLIDSFVRDIPPASLPKPAIRSSTCDADLAWVNIKSGRARLIDVRRSDRFCAGHVAGSIWAVRSRLSRLPLPEGIELLILGDTDDAAALVAQDLTAMGHARVHVVMGGLGALRAAGAPTETTPNSFNRATAIDFTWFAHGRHDGDITASQLYLEWEQGLVGQLDPEERAEFRI